MPNPVSQRYLKLFNELAKAEGFTWKKDANENGLPELDEVQLGVQWRKFNASTKASRLNAATTSIIVRIEERRRAATQEALREKYLKPYRFEYAPHELPEPVQQTLPKFHEIARLTEELRLLQLDPSGLAWMEHVQTKARPAYKPEMPAGDQNSLKLFERGYDGGCHQYIEDPFCDSVSFFPDKDPNSSMWSDDVTEQDMEKLAGHPQEAMLMSPFTVVEKTTEGEFKITEFNRHPLFASRLKRIAELFREIAATPGFSDAEPGMAGTASAYAQALERGQGPQFLDDAEIVWARARGSRIAFTWGPFEEMQDPLGKKRTFQFHLFLVRQKESEELEEYQYAVLQEMENRLAARVEGYQARNVSVPSVIQVYDVIERSGGMNSPDSEYLAEVIPNTGPVADGGFRKKQIFANIHEGAFDHVLKHIAERALVPEQVSYVQPRFFTLNGTLHELSHSIGPLRDQRVTQNGKEVTVHTAIGAGLFDAIEEAKADVGGIWMYPLLRQKELITQEEEKSGYVTYVASLMRQARFGKESPHGKGAKRQLSYLFKVGAVELRNVDLGTKRELRVHVNLDKMPQAVESLTVEIATAQHQGSKGLAEEFFTHAGHIPQEWDKVFVPRFEDIPRHIKLEVAAQQPPPLAVETPENLGGSGCSCSLGARP